MNEIDDIKRRAGITDNDGQNPELAFRPMDTKLVIQFATGKLDAVQFAKGEMINRGFDQYGKWVGFEQAAQIWK